MVVEKEKKSKWGRGYVLGPHRRPAGQIRDRGLLYYANDTVWVCSDLLQLLALQISEHKLCRTFDLLEVVTLSLDLPFNRRRLRRHGQRSCPPPNPAYIGPSPPVTMQKTTPKVHPRRYPTQHPTGCIHNPDAGADLHGSHLNL